MAFKQFTKPTKLRVIINGVSFYTTAGQVRYGVGSNGSINDCCNSALREIERSKKAGDLISGLCGTWHGHQIQMDLL